MTAAADWCIHTHGADLVTRVLVGRPWRVFTGKRLRGKCFGWQELSVEDDAESRIRTEVKLCQCWDVMC